MRRALPMTRRECLEPKHMLAAATELIERGAAHGPQADDDGVELHDPYRLQLDCLFPAVGRRRSAAETPSPRRIQLDAMPLTTGCLVLLSNDGAQHDELAHDSNSLFPAALLLREDRAHPV